MNFDKINMLEKYDIIDNNTYIYISQDFFPAFNMKIRRCGLNDNETTFH